MVFAEVKCRDLSSGLAHGWQNKSPALSKLSNVIFFISHVGMTH